MPGLSPAGQDKLLVLGLGFATCAVLGLMRQMLVHYRDSAIIPPEQNKPQYITQDVEDSLKLSTLDKLLDSPNYCIQETTAIIICERALHDGPTMDALLYHITRPDHDLREKGIRALTMMMNSTSIKALHKPEAYAALVRSLEYSRDDYEHNAFDREWDNWYFRDVVEQGCLLLLAMLADKFGTDGLVRSRFVERWLAKEPWGDTERDRATTFAGILDKQQRLNDILIPLFRDRVGRKQLIDAKLVPAEIENHFIQQGRDIRIINGEDTSGEDIDGVFVESRRREQSSEEEGIRRRNREAMVLNDGGPLRRGDIIQRER